MNDTKMLLNYDYPEGYAQEKSVKKLLKKKNRKNK